jgi:hypothetical protein
VSSRKQEAVIEADQNVRAAARTVETGIATVTLQWQKDNKGGGGVGDSTGNCDSGSGDDEDNGSNSTGKGYKRQSTKYREENVAAKAAAAVRQ